MISAETTTPSYISSKGVQFTIRLDEKINNGIVGKAKEMDVTRAELIRVALESYLETQMSSNQNSDTEGILLDQLEHVQKELAEKNEQISELLKATESESANNYVYESESEIISGSQTNLASEIIWCKCRKCLS
tara:strand:- start:5 stop:406 length:402 start_codon:yes stop_codon:yes gene_type:complete